MATTVIAKNQTAGDLSLTQLAATDAKIPASGQVTLTDYNTVTEIKDDSELIGYINTDDVLLNVNAVDYTKSQSLEFMSFDPNVVKQNNTATTDPTTGDDKDDGYSVGSIWTNTSTNESFICTDDASAAAVWISINSDEVPYTEWIPADKLYTTGTSSKVVANDFTALEVQQNKTAFGVCNIVLKKTPSSDVTVKIRYIIKSSGTGTYVRAAAKLKNVGADEDTYPDFSADQKKFTAQSVTFTTIGQQWEATLTFSQSAISFAKDDTVAVHIGRDGANSMGAGNNDDVNKAIQILGAKIRIP
jgi:hypothetical protein